jgi:hypothetical protein
MQQRVQPNNPIWKNAKLKVEFGTSDNVKQGVAENNTAAGINKMFNNLGDPVFSNLQRIALLAMQGRQQEASGRLQSVIKDASPTVQKKIIDAVNSIKPVTINGKIADSSTIDKSKQHQDWIINTFIPWVQSLLGQQGVAEGWSQKYKKSINCSHPKGFSQKAHCAGKKKHNESIDNVMEMTCPDCGMCQSHGDNSKDKLDELKCWSGFHRVAGTKAGFPGSCAKNKTNEEQVLENLHKWFKEKWVRFGPDGKIRGDCARGSESEGKPKCLPQSKAHSLGKKGRASAASRKRREDPNANRSGKAINVSTKGKGK